MKKGSKKTVYYTWEYYKPDSQGRAFHPDADWEWFENETKYQSLNSAIRRAKIWTKKNNKDWEYIDFYRYEGFVNFTSTHLEKD